MTTACTHTCLYARATLPPPASAATLLLRSPMPPLTLPAPARLPACRLPPFRREIGNDDEEKSK
jgi:hypothetical protein